MSKIDKYKSSERTVDEELINTMCNLGKYNDLILFDRGYPSINYRLKILLVKLLLQ